MNFKIRKLTMGIRLPGVILMAFAVFGSAMFATAAGRKIQLPRESALYRPGPGVESANAYCLTCHSADYAAIQPRMPLAFWQANVKKMREKYGAEIPDAAAEILVNYLAAAYGHEQSSAAVAVLPASSPRLPGEDSKSTASLEKSDAKTLVARFGCVACHGADRKIVGPAFNAVAAKYRNDSGGSVKVLHQIQQGGGGQWGSVPMPPFPQIPAEDANAIARWILALK
jgi:cytochrome c551/c552